MPYEDSNPANETTDESATQLHPGEPESTVDPGEAYVAVVGLLRVLQDTPGRLTAPEKLRINQLGDEVAKLGYALVCGELTTGRASTYPGCPAYSTLLDVFSSQPGEEMFAKVSTSVDGELAIQTMTALSRAWQFASAALPRQSYSTQVRTTNLLPAETAVWLFEDLLELLANPIPCVFDRIARGELLVMHGQAIRSVYPSLAQAIDLAIDDAIIDELAKLQSFTLHPDVEFGVAAWRGQMPDAAPYQDAYMLEPSQAPGASSKSVLAADSESGIQRAALGASKPQGA